MSEKIRLYAGTQHGLIIWRSRITAGRKWRAILKTALSIRSMAANTRRSASLSASPMMVSIAPSMAARAGRECSKAIFAR